MKIIELKEKLNSFIVFSLNDIRKLNPQFDLRRLTEWRQKGYIKKVIREYYIFSDLKINEPVLFIIANKIYNPSYISLEKALSSYHLIPESVYGITSVSTRKTSSFKTRVGEFIYKSIKTPLMFGYNLIPYQNYSFKIADLEKAILDYFYINPHISRDDFHELRIDKNSLLEQLDKGKLVRYLDVFQNKALENRIKKFLEFINNA